jgi:hypothetical protein
MLISDIHIHITWQHHIGENWHNRATTSGGECSITTEDGRVRPKHVLIDSVILYMT